VVAHLLRLKLLLLRNLFRRSRAQTIGMIAGIAYFSFAVVGVAVLLGALRTSLDDARIIIPLVGAATVVLWTVVPLFTFGSDPTLDPARFATFAVPTRDLAIALALCALIGLPAIATCVVMTGVLVAWTMTPASAAVGLPCVVIGVLTAVTTSRWVSARATGALQSRRGRDALAVTALVLLLAVGPLAAFVGSAGEDARSTAALLSDVVSWTPLGWVWAAPTDVAAGHVLLGLLRLVLGAATLLVLGRLWARAVADQVENPRAVARSDAGVAADGDLGLFARTPDTPGGAVAGRVLTYYRRDPRFQVALITTPLVPLVLLVPFIIGDVLWAPLLMGPMVAFLLGFGEHNAVAFDSDALWLHLATGTPGVADRRGRLVASALLAVVLVPAYVLVGAGLGQRLDLAGGLLGLSVALLGAGYGLSSVMNVVLPYPVPESGESPFASRPGAAGATLLAQAAASLGTTVIAAPVLLLAWLGWQGQVWAVWATAVLGVVLGLVAARVGVGVGARLFERRGPELLAALRRT
jgi:ABC-2 type transport system permease protein